MRLIPTEYKNVMYKKTKLLDIIEEFEKMEAECVCLEDHGYTSVVAAVATLNSAAKRYGRSHIKAFSRGGKAYLVNLIKAGKM